MWKVHSRIVAVAVAALLAGASAAPLTAQMEDEHAQRLTPKEEPDLPDGKYAFAEGAAGSPGHRFYLENLSVLQPVTVTLIARNPGDEIRLALGKYRYDEPDRTATTDAEGVARERLRTQGELKIEVSSSGAPKPYLLSVWVGKEVTPEMPPLLVPASQVEDAGGGSGFDLGGSPVLWVIAVALIGILALLAKIVLSKGGPA